MVIKKGLDFPGGILKTIKIVKYFIYSYTWQTGERKPGSGCATDIYRGKGMVDLYEYTLQQPETWCLTHVSEITKEEYDIAKANGLIG